jgi:hypothetical protein
VEAEITWESPYPIDNVELIHDGQVIASQSWSAECRSGALRTRATIAADGWLAARLSGSTRDSFWQPVFAHTSPVWLTTGVTGTKAGVAARSFVRALDDAILWVETSGRFHDARQKAEVLDLYRAGQAAYTGIAGRAGKQD